jgi:drug/metabolite transporter (DMT)-like permease
MYTFKEYNFLLFSLFRKERPALTLNFVVQFFLLALVGYDSIYNSKLKKRKKIKIPKENNNSFSCFVSCVMSRITANQGFYLLGLENTSPTFASAIQNSVPAITFLMAALLRQAPFPYLSSLSLSLTSNQTFNLVHTQICSKGKHAFLFSSAT